MGAQDHGTHIHKPLSQKSIPEREVRLGTFARGTRGLSGGGSFGRTGADGADSSLARWLPTRFQSLRDRRIRSQRDRGNAGV